MTQTGAAARTHAPASTTGSRTTKALRPHIDSLSSIGRLDDVQLVLAVVASSTFALLVTLATYRIGLLDGAQDYPDIIAGELAFDDHYKARDFRGGFLFVGVALLSLPFLLWLTCRWSRRSSGALGLFLLPLGLAAAALVNEIVLRSPTRSVAVIGLTAVCIGGVATVAVARSAARRDVILSLLTGPLSLLAVAALLLLPTGTPVLAAARAAVGGHPFIAWTTTLGVSLLTFALVAYRALPLRPLYRGVLLVQVPVPLVIPAVLRGEYVIDGTLRWDSVPGSTRVLFAMVAVGVTVLQVRWVRRHWTTVSSTASAAIGPVTVLSAAIFVSLVTPLPNAVANPDDFHNGENVIQWRQLTHFGLSPFDEFYPVPGLIGALVGGINVLLLERTAESFPIAAALVRTGFLVVIAACLSALVGRGWALLMVLLLPLVTSDRVFVPLSLLMVLALPRLLRNPLAWLSVWAIGGYLTVLLMPASGAAAILAAAPLGGFVTVRLIRSVKAKGPSQRRSPRQVVPGVVLVALAALLGVPLALDVISYLRVSSGANMLAYGLGLTQFPFYMDFSGLLPPRVGRAVFEAVRFSAWLFTLPLLVALLVRAVARTGGKGLLAVPGNALALIASCYLVAIIPYAWGRIDPGNISRPGIYSTALLLFVVPAVLLARPGRATGLASTVLVGAVFAAALVSPVSPTSVIAAAMSPTVIPADYVMLQDGGVEEPHLGDLALPPDRASELQRTDRVMNGVLQRDESFFDMTNRALLYEVLDRPVPTPYSGEYYAADEMSQRIVIKSLEQDPPPVVLVATPPVGGELVPGPRPVSISPSLRSYRVYRWFLENGYRPLVRENVHMLVRPDRAVALAAPSSSPQQLAAMFRPPSLDALPRAWGRSWSALRSRFDGGVLLDEVTGPGGDAAWAVPARTEGDFLLLNLACSGHSADTLVPALLRWGTERWQSLELLLSHGRHLVPLGSNPAWFSRGGNLVLTLTVTPGTSCAGAEADARLYELMD